jgi:hypothetical protein
MLRKEANLSLHDETNIYLAGADEELKSVLTKKKSDIRRDTLSAELYFSDTLPEVLVSKEIKIDDVKLQLGLRK